MIPILHIFQVIKEIADVNVFKICRILWKEESEGKREIIIHWFISQKATAAGLELTKTRRLALDLGLPRGEQRPQLRLPSAAFPGVLAGRWTGSGAAGLIAAD